MMEILDEKETTNELFNFTTDDIDTWPGTKSLKDFAILLYLVPLFIEEPLKFLVAIMQWLPIQKH